jgi:hypothetical protein
VSTCPRETRVSTMLDLDAIFDPDRPISAGASVQREGGEFNKPVGGASEDAIPLVAVPNPLVHGHVCCSPLQEWSSEDRELVAFFQSARLRLPLTPFRLTPWQFISDPAKWYRTLDLDISLGPLGSRAHMGTLQEDLRRLQEHVAGP